MEKAGTWLKSSLITTNASGVSCVCSLATAKLMTSQAGQTNELFCTHGQQFNIWDAVMLLHTNKPGSTLSVSVPSPLLLPLCLQSLSVPVLSELSKDWWRSCSWDLKKDFNHFHSDVEFELMVEDVKSKSLICFEGMTTAHLEGDIQVCW